jgi:hypothetical protein
MTTYRRRKFARGGYCEWGSIVQNLHNSSNPSEQQSYRHGFPTVPCSLAPSITSIRFAWLGEVAHGTLRLVELIISPDLLSSSALQSALISHTHQASNEQKRHTNHSGKSGYPGR